MIAATEARDADQRGSAKWQDFLIRITVKVVGLFQVTLFAYSIFPILSIKISLLPSLPRRLSSSKQYRAFFVSFARTSHFKSRRVAAVPYCHSFANAYAV